MDRLPKAWRTSSWQLGGEPGADLAAHVDRCRFVDAFNQHAICALSDLRSDVLPRLRAARCRGVPAEKFSFGHDPEVSDAEKALLDRTEREMRSVGEYGPDGVWHVVEYAPEETKEGIVQAWARKWHIDAPWVREAVFEGVHCMGLENNRGFALGDPTPGERDEAEARSKDPNNLRLRIADAELDYLFRVPQAPHPREWNPIAESAEHYLERAQQYVEWVARAALEAGLKPSPTKLQNHHFQWFVSYQVEGCSQAWLVENSLTGRK